MIERLSNQNDGLHQVNQEQQVRIAELEYQIREIHAWGGVKSGVDSSHSMSTSQLGEAGLAIVAGENSTYLEGCDQPIKCSNNLG